MLTRPYLPSPRPLRLLVLLGVVLALAFGATESRALAAQPEPSIEGTWMLSFPNDDPTLRHLAAFLPGGVVMATNAPTFSEESAHGGRVHSTEGLGVWVRLDDGRYAFTVVYLYYDVEEQPWGTLTVDGVVTLDASGNRFRGTFNVDVVDAIGALLFSSQDEPIAGTRVRVRTIPTGAGAEAGATATAAALRIFDAVLGPCRSEDPPGGQTRITPSDRLPGADAARWRETAGRGIATFVSETCHGGIAGVALGRTATGEWGLLRVPPAGPGPALQLPREMFV